MSPTFVATNQPSYPPNPYAIAIKGKPWSLETLPMSPVGL